jgi:pimeloyl-ACP methyl ester carboxylesterase
MARELEVNDSSRRTSQRREGTMNATRLIEEWRGQGRILKVEGANTVLWRMGQGETVICIHGVPTSSFLYRKLLPELASRGLEGVTVDLPGLGLPAWSPQLGAPRATSATLCRDGTGALSLRCRIRPERPRGRRQNQHHEIGVTLEARHPLQHIFREADLAEFTVAGRGDGNGRTPE